MIGFVLTGNKKKVKGESYRQVTGKLIWLEEAINSIKLSFNCTRLSLTVHIMARGVMLEFYHRNRQAILFKKLSKFSFPRFSIN